MIKHFLYISVFGLLSCREEIGERRLSNAIHAAPCKITIVKDQHMVKDKETCIRLVPDRNNFRIVKAYYECKKEKIREYDTINKRIKNCTDELLLEDDSVRIYFAQPEIGKFKFGNITLLLKDDLENLYFIDTTFFYDVVQLTKQ